MTVLDINDRRAAGEVIDINDAIPIVVKEEESRRDKKPKPAALGREFLSDHSFFSSNSHLYVYRDGVYLMNGEEIVRKWVQDRLDLRSTKHAGNEVVYWLTNARRADPDKLDSGQLVNVGNGLLDWRTGELQPHTPKVLSTVQLPTDWDPDAYHERADQFLDEVLPDSETRSVIEEFFGYSLMTDCRYQKAAMFTGEAGRNGKSVLIDWLKSMLGDDNCSNVKLQDLDDRFRTVKLLGKLINAYADLPREALKDTGTFKMLVTGDELTAEVKYKDAFNFRNRAKLIFSANELPGTSDRSGAFFRRWLVVDFPRRFTPETPGYDPHIGDKLKVPEARSYLLRLAVAGLQRLNARGYFRDTPAMRDALAEYRRDADHILAFYEDCCEYVGGDTWTSKEQVFKEYVEWCDGTKHHPVTDNVFAKRLRNLDPRLRSARRGGREGRSMAWDGLQLRVRGSEPEPCHGLF